MKEYRLLYISSFLQSKSNRGPHNECFTVAKKNGNSFSQFFVFCAVQCMGRIGHGLLNPFFYSRGRCVVLFLQITESEFVKLLRTPGIDSQSGGIDSWAPQTFSNNGFWLQRLAGLYDNPNPTQFLAPLDCSKIPAQIRAL